MLNIDLKAISSSFGNIRESERSFWEKMWRDSKNSWKYESEFKKFRMFHIALQAQQRKWWIWWSEFDIFRFKRWLISQESLVNMPYYH